jgi:hypothetical protein
MVEDSDFEGVLDGSVGRGKSAEIEVSGPPVLRGIGNEVGKDEGSVWGRYAVAVCMSRLEDM